MSTASAVFVALISISHVAGITGTIFDYAEYAAFNIADRAQMNRFELAEWYREGMQLSAFTTTSYVWNKNPITWGVLEDSARLRADQIKPHFVKAFKRWSARTPLVFNEPEPRVLPDIKIHVKTLDPSKIILVNYPSTDFVLDLRGVHITFNDFYNWTDENGEDFRDLRFAAVYMVGNVLGLGDSQYKDAIMSPLHEGFKRRKNLTLHADDIDGIQYLYPNGP